MPPAIGPIVGISGDEQSLWIVDANALVASYDEDAEVWSTIPAPGSPPLALPELVRSGGRTLMTYHAEDGQRLLVWDEDSQRWDLAVDHWEWAPLSIYTLTEDRAGGAWTTSPGEVRHFNGDQWTLSEVHGLIEADARVVGTRRGLMIHGDYTRVARTCAG